MYTLLDYLSTPLAFPSKPDNIRIYRNTGLSAARTGISCTTSRAFAVERLERRATCDVEAVAESISAGAKFCKISKFLNERERESDDLVDPQEMMNNEPLAAKTIRLFYSRKQTGKI